MNFYFFIFEFGTIFALLTVICHERRDRKMLEILTLSFCYGIILEALNMYMSHVYTYSKDFIFQILDVPLAIGAGWAIVYYLSHKSAERLNLLWWQTPFVMALIALSYDLSLDAIAIRLGFWKWNIPMNEEWFGVPYDNFYGWLAVVWTFGLFINLSYQDFIKPQARKAIRYVAPIASALLLGMEIMVYENLAAVLSGKFTWSETMKLYNRQDYSYAYLPEVRTTRIYLFLLMTTVLVVICLYWIYKQKKSIKNTGDSFPFYVSLAAHAMFISFMFLSGIYKISWLLVFISFAVLAIGAISEIPTDKYCKKR